MFPKDRQELIVEYLEKNKKATISDLTEQFGVSVITIRRDLEILEEEGHIKKIYGGAAIVDRPAADSSMQHPYFYSRILSHHQEKEAIGRAAAKFINDGDTIILGIGTTCLEIAKNIKNRTDVTVLTNSLAVLNELVDTHLEVHALGGRLRSRELSLSGSQAFSALDAFCAAKAFLGIGAISIENGLTDYNRDSAELSAAMMHKAGEVFLVADNTKFGKNSFSVLGGLDCIQTLITDRDAPEQYIEAFKACGVSVVIAE